MDYYDPMLRLTHLSLLAALVFTSSANAQTLASKATAPIRSTLDSRLFYQLLLGELNARTGDPGAGYALMLDAARKTNNSNLYQRAVEIALQARSGDSALRAARAWKQALPASKEANRYVLQILIGLNRLSDTLEPLKQEIATTPPDNRAEAISLIPRYFARATDKKLAAALVEQALTGDLVSAATGVAAWIVIGRMRQEAGDTGAALSAARKAQALDAYAEGPARLALSIMDTTPQAEAIVKKYIDGKPLPETRMGYARALLGAQRYADATVQLQAITTDQPDFSEAWLIRGLLELQENKLVQAESSFNRYVKLATSNGQAATHTEMDRGLTQAYLSLAQIAEQKKDFAAADTWLQRVERPEDLLAAQLRRASLLAQQGKVEEGRELIQSQSAKSPTEARLKLTAEVQLLREDKQFASAYELLAEATSRSPEDLDLVYDMAMVAEKLGKFDEMESMLRSVIARKSDYHHAYNALGYSLADRNTRLPEARLLILKALEYVPDDPFMADSLGWVEFRSGHLEEARRILQGAFDAKADAEIAAHLGEVLWAMGQQAQAIRIWQAGIQLNATNETLLETLKRLRVKW